MKRRWLLAALAAVILVGWYLLSRRGAEMAPAIRGVGTLEAIEVNIAAKVSGRIVYLCCREGDPVKKGDMAVRLDSEELTAAVRQAQAGVGRAVAGVAVARSAIDSSRAALASAEADIGDAAAQVEITRAQMEEAQRYMQRRQELLAQASIARETVDTAVTAYKTAAAGHAASKARLEVSRARRDQAATDLASARSGFDASNAAVRQAEADLAVADARLADTSIASPLAGVVVFRSHEEGEVVSPGATILTVDDLDHLYVRVDIDETLLNGLALHQQGTVWPAGRPDQRFSGEVIEIGPYAAFATETDVTRGRQDIRTFRIKVAVRDPEHLLHPGMTMAVAIPGNPAP